MTASSDDGVRAGGDSGSDSSAVEGDDVPIEPRGDEVGDGAGGAGGDDGDGGADGSDGNDMPTGPVGDDGNDGADGTDGNAGDDSVDGTDGDDVPTGAGSDDGNDGADSTDGDDGVDGDDAEVQPMDAFAPYELHIDLRSFEVVDEFLKSKGISDDSTEDEILQWVPSAIVIRMWPSRVQQGIGIDAEGGYVAFNIANADASLYIYASYLIVTDLYGENVTVKVIDAATEAYGQMHFDGLKVST